MKPWKLVTHTFDNHIVTCLGLFHQSLGSETRWINVGESSAFFTNHIVVSIAHYLIVKKSLGAVFKRLPYRRKRAQTVFELAFQLTHEIHNL